MYNNPYFSNYQIQNNLDAINNNIAELEKMKNQLQNRQQSIQQPTNLTQNFQLAPSNNGFMKYANTIDDVNKDIVFGDTPYFSKDMSILWIKTIKGDIKTYELNEIIPRDEKDIQIEYLQSQIEELKGMIKNEKFNTDDNTEQNGANTTKHDETIRKSIEKSESPSIQRVSTSKKR